MGAALFPDGINCLGNARISGVIEPRKTRSQILAMSDLECFTIPMTWWRVWDAMQTNLPGTPANDDLGLVGGTFGTNHASLQTSDVGGATATQYARAMIPLPSNYVAGQTVTLRFHAGMHTTIADDVATLDVSAYHCDEDRTLEALGDICGTNLQSINSLTYADIDFSITPTNLSPGDLLDVRIKVVATDAGDLGADIRGVIGSAQRLCDVR